MLQSIQEHPALAAGLIGVLLAIVVYFARKIDNKIDEHTNLITDIKTELTVQLATHRDDIKTDVTSAFNDICCERQGMCSKLQEAKLGTLQATNVAICAKLARLDEERRDAWTHQRRWNDKIESTIYSDKHNGGK